MLERATTCPRSGGRNLLRISSAPVRTRRSLHVAFWNHGGHDLDPFQCNASPASQSEPKSVGQNGTGKPNSRGNGPANLPDAPTLDFLYPAKTLATLRRISVAKSASWGTCRETERIGKGLRTYSSAAAEVTVDSISNAQTAFHLSVPPSKPAHTSAPNAKYIAELRRLLDHPRRNDYERAWNLWRQGHLEIESLDLTARVLTYLTTSERPVDLKRAFHLYNILPSEKDAQSYRDGIVLYLKAKNFLKALGVHREAVEQLKGSGNFGTHIIMVRAINVGNWRLALETWEGFKRVQGRSLEAGQPGPSTYDLWRLVIGSDGFLQRAVSLAEFVKSQQGNDDYERWKSFAIELINYTLSARKFNPLHGRIYRFASDVSDNTPRQQSTDLFTASQDVVKYRQNVNNQFNSYNFHQQVIKSRPPTRPRRRIMQEAPRTDPVARFAYRLADILLEFGAMKEEQFADAIQIFQQRRNIPLVFSLYNKVRKEEGFSLSHRILFEILRNAISVHSVSDIETLLADWYKFHGRPPVLAFQAAMTELAAHGHAEKVHSLFDELRSIHPAEEIDFMNVLPSLLYVHARRAEVGETVRQFERIYKEFKLHQNLRCWNILIYAHTRVGDLEGALKHFSNLLSTRLPVDEFSFGTIMGICANRGDVDNVRSLITTASSRGITRSTTMMNCLVLAYVKSGNIKYAELLLHKLRKSTLRGSRTRMWNYVIVGWAQQRNIMAAQRVFRGMRMFHVRQDEWTYAAMMQLWAICQRPDDAWKMLRVGMPRQKLRPTAQHYAIVMGGYLACRQSDKVFNVYRHMLAHDIKPNFATQVLILKASANAKQSGESSRRISQTDMGLAQAEEILDRMMRTTDPSEIAAQEPRKSISNQPLDQAYPAAYFDFLIFTLGQRGAFGKVQKLYNDYLTLAKTTHPDKPVEPPIKLLSALMVTNLRQGKYDELTRCWNFAVQQAKRQARGLSDPDTSQPGWVLKSQRYLLLPPFPYLVKGLAAAGQCDKLIATVREMLAAGFDLNNRNWNLYVQTLAQNNHGVEAFQICEAKLMQKWRGWGRHNKRYRRIYLLGAENKPPSNKRAITDILVTYKTLVVLASFLVQLRSQGPSKERATTLESIRSVAPRTLDAVQRMPKTEDEFQIELLRQE
ncbi:hypothetical protein L228DRAFT_246181 [Xylona heveae TC161]|uniref:PROP1-like PPR domain-containing protein n=1 Tax=Xylona heveae (strain CBS 132557 / TC161) TaxID=1328760 RepID=A0A165HEZ0_XYLHT|nr:hypothetical protein L228DRAFT_246181 [Xylona heveae TC161]KZF23411.1 hypothetical protein L228DRAFT_246181 [Xylona heveae TC161]